MFTGVNIESSATCNLKCRMCPTLSYPSHLRNGYMDIETFVLARPVMDDLPGGVDLTGWGEPLMNPYLPAFMESVEGVTLTTNAHHMDHRMSQRMVANKVGAVAVSIDAASQEMYRRLHLAGDSGVVWRNIEGLRKVREINGAVLPTIGMHFLIMAQNVAELPEFVERAARFGADEVVAKHIAIFSRPGQEREALFTGFFKNGHPDTALLDDMVAKSREKAAECGITFRKVGSNVARPMAGCFGGAISRPFVAVNGDVSPCCVLAHEAPRLNPKGEARPGPTLYYGNVHKTPLEKIWNIDEYGEFRERLQSGDTPDECRHCLGAWSVTLASDD